LVCMAAGEDWALVGVAGDGAAQVRVDGRLQIRLLQNARRTANGTAGRSGGVRNVFRIVRAGRDKLRGRLCCWLRMDQRRRCDRARSRGSMHLRIVHPTSPVRAILWLLGRPWEGSREARWPNGFVAARPFDSAAVPCPSGRAARMLARLSFGAMRLWWCVREQLGLLVHETLWRLAGMRGTTRGGPKTPRRTRAETCGHSESCGRDRSAAHATRQLQTA
jgi:hypothetical protein